MKTCARSKWVVATGLTFALVATLAAADVADTFNRADSDKPGRTETGDAVWTPVAANNPKAVQIMNKRLLLDYNLGPSPTVACALEKFRAADLDVSFIAYFHYDGESRLAGVSYRLESPVGVFNDPGYHVFLNPAYVVLTYGPRELARKEAAFPVQTDHKVRVVVQGQRHQVYVNDQLLLDVKDETTTDPGHVSFCVYYQQLYVGGVNITVLKQAQE